MSPYSLFSLSISPCATENRLPKNLFRKICFFLSNEMTRPPTTDILEQLRNLNDTEAKEREVKYPESSSSSSSDSSIPIIPGAKQYQHYHYHNPNKKRALPTSQQQPTIILTEARLNQIKNNSQVQRLYQFTRSCLPILSPKDLEQYPHYLSEQTDIRMAALWNCDSNSVSYVKVIPSSRIENFDQAYKRYLIPAFQSIMDQALNIIKVTDNPFVIGLQLEVLITHPDLRSWFMTMVKQLQNREPSKNMQSISRISIAVDQYTLEQAIEFFVQCVSEDKEEEEGGELVDIYYGKRFFLPIIEPAAEEEEEGVEAIGAEELDEFT